jgi:hypothetical protein
MGLITLMKGPALAWANKDNQEDKEPLFDTVDTLERHAAISLLKWSAGVDAIHRPAQRRHHRWWRTKNAQRHRTTFFVTN